MNEIAALRDRIRKEAEACYKEGMIRTANTLCLAEKAIRELSGNRNVRICYSNPNERQGESDAGNEKSI